MDAYRELGGKVVELYIWVLVLFNISAVLGEEVLEFFNVFSTFFLFRSSSFDVSELFSHNSVQRSKCNS